MTSLEIQFPREWSVVSTNPVATDADRLVEGLGDLGAGVQLAMKRYLDALLPGLRSLGVDALAALFISAEDPRSTIQAACAIGTVAAEPDSKVDLELLTRIAEGGPHPGLERDTSTVALPVSMAVRSSAIRFAVELADEDGVAPYVGEIRYAFEAAPELVGVLHFETQTLAYFDDIEQLSDLIAGTVRLSQPAHGV